MAHTTVADIVMLGRIRYLCKQDNPSVEIIKTSVSRQLLLVSVSFMVASHSPSNASSFLPPLPQSSSGMH